MYILADRYRGGLYVGSTSDLAQRCWQHREGFGSEHVRKYGKLRLVYAEWHETIDAAQDRERLVKRWHRDWKFRLIEEGNPGWLDLYDTLNN